MNWVKLGSSLLNLDTVLRIVRVTERAVVVEFTNEQSQTLLDDDAVLLWQQLVARADGSLAGQTLSVDEWTALLERRPPDTRRNNRMKGGF